MPCAPPVTTATWPSKSNGVALTRYLLSNQPYVTQGNLVLYSRSLEIHVCSTLLAHGKGETGTRGRVSGTPTRPRARTPRTRPDYWAV